MPVDQSDPLWLAIEHDRPDELRDLLVAGRRPEYDAGDGWSPLHHAVDVEGDGHSQAGAPLDLRLVAPLLAAGAEVNVIYVDERRRSSTPIDLAREYQHDPAVEAITTAGGLSAGEVGAG
jgi:hypothetical protein